MAAATNGKKLSAKAELPEIQALCENAARAHLSPGHKLSWDAKRDSWVLNLERPERKPAQFPAPLRHVHQGHRVHQGPAAGTADPLHQLGRPRVVDHSIGQKVPRSSPGGSLRKTASRSGTRRASSPPSRRRERRCRRCRGQEALAVHLHDEGAGRHHQCPGQGARQAWPGQDRPVAGLAESDLRPHHPQGSGYVELQRPPDQRGSTSSGGCGPHPGGVGQGENPRRRPLSCWTERTLWHSTAITGWTRSSADPALDDARAELAEPTSEDAARSAFVTLLEAEPPAARGVAFDHYRYAEASSRFGEAICSPKSAQRVLQRARETLRNLRWRRA